MKKPSSSSEAGLFHGGADLLGCFLCALTGHMLDGALLCRRFLLIGTDIDGLARQHRPDQEIWNRLFYTNIISCGLKVNVLSSRDEQRGGRNGQDQRAQRPPVRMGVSPPPAPAGLDRKDQPDDYTCKRDRKGQQAAVETAQDFHRR
jgi:hypothetical protein